MFQLRKSQASLPAIEVESSAGCELRKSRPSVLGLKKLEAQILDSQEGARIAFEQLGFREEARLRAHALDVNNRLHDLLILTHKVDDPGLSMEILIEDLDFSRAWEGY